jgi:hypothetical protein
MDAWKELGPLLLLNPLCSVQHRLNVFVILNFSVSSYVRIHISVKVRTNVVEEKYVRNSIDPYEFSYEF